MQRALNSERYSDFEIHCQGKVFKVNKLTFIKSNLQNFQVSTFILKVHSEIFVAALQPYTKEAQSNTLVITNFDAETVKQMLIYMYSGKVDNLDEVVYSLFEIADYYQILTLMVSYFSI
jgi:hypothetical protein